MDQGLCYCNSNARESRVISITDQLILENGKKAPKCTEGTVTGPKHCPAALLKQHQPV